MALTQAEKRAVVAEVAEVAATAHSAVAAEYRGLTVDKLTDPLAVGDAGRILCQRRGNGNVVDLFKAARALTFQGAGTGDEDDRRTFAPCFHDRGYSIRKTLRSDKANGRLTRDARVTIRKMPGDLLVWAIDDGHLAFHEAFECRIAKASRKGEDMLDAFLMQSACE